MAYRYRPEALAEPAQLRCSLWSAASTATPAAALQPCLVGAVVLFDPAQRGEDVAADGPAVVGRSLLKHVVAADGEEDAEESTPGSSAVVGRLAPGR